MSKRDNHTHWRLVNWGKAQNLGMSDAGIPPQHPKTATWQKQIKGDGWLDLDAPDPIDEDDAEATQYAMVRCMIHDMKTATILTKHYRDGWAAPGLSRARYRFWKFL